MSLQFLRYKLDGTVTQAVTVASMLLSFVSYGPLLSLI